MLSLSEKETIELGYKIGKKLKQGYCLTLKGDLAGGKTTFTKGIGQALNIKQVINSPTFTILKIYEGDLKLFHIDAYRLEGAEYDLGLDEYLDEGVMIVEWPEYYGDYLPKEYLEISFKYIDDNTREINFRPAGKKYEELIEC
ncbi:MAG: tRNA (adenosine(37)-N6)-threonylcarbamoyltransferase complex ATPase subunit type 1 TsaE [Erysipelotrichaceae bacterium]|nr:tRNA (adenosine(37)-N6)-threonylcarbamoyltransferase complex ATPase subunit type 1 TsaE [Erysipelotrichaceae bacterium]